MSDNRAHPEPSMEEILSSISRIIAEDKPSDAAGASAEEEVLHLTEAIGDDGAVRHLTPPAGASGSSERIVSPPTAAAAATALGQLAEAARDRRREGDVAIGSSGRTLEDIVQEMMRPLLQAWLDQHLAGLVERLVREEIARVAGEAGLR
jgi:uncharacterized protein